ncbi:MAG: hypothetical protein HYX69_14020 [Planctomycetia bacterium]|nr:hypothetical protein [Planctomycetia bacterium]
MLATCLALALTASSAAPDTVVVCPDALRPALAPWLVLRERQGHGCVVVPAGSAEQIRARIRGAAGKSLRFVLLVGDAAPEPFGRPGATGVPTHYTASKVVSRFGGSATIAGDNWYADLDDDQLPDVAIGRLTADTPPQLGRIVAKVLAYERGLTPGNWLRRINLVAGLGGFGQLADAAIEATAKRLLSDGIPPAYATTVTYGSWRSPYCPDPRLFHAAALARFNEGCLFWVYMGHGRERVVDRVRAPDGTHHIFDVNDCGQLHCAAAPPIALLLCCSAGAFDERDDCLAEEMVAADQGPVATIAGSRVTMPYGTSVLGAEMLRVHFQERAGTLGELLLQAKRATMLRARDDTSSRAIDSLAAILNPASNDLAAERQEHVELFNLLGDPLLRLPRAADAKVIAPASVRAGSVLAVAGTSPIDGRAAIELVVRRDRLTFRPPERGRYETSDSARREFQETYERANDARLASCETATAGRQFEARLEVPRDASGPCHVRVFVQGEREVAVGSADVTIDEAQP